MKFQTVRNIKGLKGKTVLLRVAYDVPLAKSGKGWKVADDRRIKETLPTIEYLLKSNCKIVLLSWLKRPGGQVVEKYKMDPVAKALSKLLKKKVKKLDDCIGPKVFKEIGKMKPGNILMLENVRFYKEEEENSKLFSALLVHGIDLIVFDAFAQAHRVHSSTVGITELLPTYAGLLLEKEVNALTKIKQKPKRPFVLIIGGAKISDKVGVLTSLAAKADKILIGGGAANVFMKAKKVPIGKSYFEDIFVDKAKKKKIKPITVAKTLLKKYPNKFLLPTDFLAATKMKENALREVIDLSKGQHIRSNWMFLDIGPHTVAEFMKEIKRAKTIFFNGPMGVFEISKFEFGTKKIAQAIARNNNTSVVGGGDTEQVLDKYGLSGKFTHVSTGGGASLELLAHDTLPAFKNILKK